jgi:uncharacterized protein YjbJ (UPF0337 family)
MANDDEVKGKFENLKGRAKQAAGAAVGNKSMEAEGAGERVKGAVQEKIGQAKGEPKAPPPDDEDEDL